jgi:hypothetical protein
MLAVDVVSVVVVPLGLLAGVSNQQRVYVVVEDIYSTTLYSGARYYTVPRGVSLAEDISTWTRLTGYHRPALINSFEFRVRIAQ